METRQFQNKSSFMPKALPLASEVFFRKKKGEKKEKEKAFYPQTLYIYCSHVYLQAATPWSAASQVSNDRSLSLDLQFEHRFTYCDFPVTCASHGWSQFCTADIPPDWIPPESSLVSSAVHSLHWHTNLSKWIVYIHHHPSAKNFPTEEKTTLSVLYLILMSSTS